MLRLQISCPQCHKVFQGTITRVAREIVCSQCSSSIPFPPHASGEMLWLVSKNKWHLGPFSRTQLAELASTQQIDPGDKVRQEGTIKWIEAGKVPGLFSPLEKDAPAPPAAAPQNASLLNPAAPKYDPSEDVFGDVPSSTPPGPLSLKGIKVRHNFSLTLGDFQILRKLGAGGMGAVYLANQRSLGRPVALKVLADALSDKDTFVNRFHREVMALSSLDHPNIVKFLGAGQEKGIPFFAMEFIEGFSTADLVRQRGRFSVGDALYIAQQVAEAMHHALTQKIVHRDIKPENIMITRQGRVKIADLGLAKSLEDDLNLTDTNTGLGSPKFMAPEQSRNAKQADHRSDIFSLGGVLYYLVTGEIPFKGTTAMELLLAKEQKIIIPPRRLNPEVPPRLDLIIEKMLAKEPRYRYQSYRELIQDLESLGLTPAALSLNVGELAPTDDFYKKQNLVEILLIDDDLDNTVRLAKQALEENHIPSNLVVVNDGAEARAFLRREGKFLFAPEPDLIIFGNTQDPEDSLRTLEEIKISNTLRNVPLVMLTDDTDMTDYFQSRGFHVHLIVNDPKNPEQFDKLFKSVQGLHLTILEFRPDS